MIRNFVVALCLMGGLAIHAVMPTPAEACGYIRAPVDTKAELAAIQKALPQAKLSDAEREQVMQLLETARRGKTARMTSEFERALADAMKLLGIERIFQKHSYMTIRIPVVTS